MKVIINEHQEKLFEAYSAPPEFADRIRRVNSEKMELENYIESHGEYMIDITNGKTYLVQYLRALSELVGKEYAVCAPVRKDGTYGAFYVKPWDTFRIKQGLTRVNGTSQAPVKKNLYQRMGFNK